MTHLKIVDSTVVQHSKRLELPPVESTSGEIACLILLVLKKNPDLILHYMKEYNVDDPNKAIELVLRRVIDSCTVNDFENGIRSVLVDGVERWECVHCKQQTLDIDAAVDCCAEFKHFDGHAH